MLNYIWSGLIVASLVFALWFDVGDLARDTYRNSQALPVEIVLPAEYDPEARFVAVEIWMDPVAYLDFYGTDAAPGSSYRGELVQTREGRQIRFAADSDLPEPLATIQEVSSSQEGELQGALTGFDPGSAVRSEEGGRGPTTVECASSR